MPNKKIKKIPLSQLVEAGRATGGLTIADLNMPDWLKRGLAGEYKITKLDPSKSYAEQLENLVDWCGEEKQND